MFLPNGDFKHNFNYKEYSNQFTHSLYIIGWIYIGIFVIIIYWYVY